MRPLSGIIPLLGILAAGCALQADTPASRPALVDVDAALRTRFHDAALYCDLRLLDGLTVADATSIGDQALVGYAQTQRRLSNPQPSTGPHADQAPVTSLDPIANPCHLGASMERGPDTDSRLEDGFCRADFNYCLGQELSLHAQSLPDGGEHTALRIELLRRARERLQASGLEYASAIAFFDVVCAPGGTPELFPYECGTRLASSGPSFLPTAHARLIESASRVVDLAHLEAGLRVDLGDRQQHATAPPAALQTVDGLFGPEGSRTAGVAVFYGPPDGVNFESRANFRRLTPVATPTLAHTDEGSARVLELMRQYRVPSAFYRMASDEGIGVVASIAVDTHYELLDHRLAAERFMPPYDTLHPADPSTDLGTILRSRRALSEAELSSVTAHVFAPHESILRGEFGITIDDVARAVVLAADAYETQYGRLLVEPQVLYDSGLQLLAASELTASMRPPEMVAAAFGDEAGLTSADALLPLLTPMPRDVAAGTSGEWYAWDLARVDGSQGSDVAVGVQASLGAVGALHLLRVHLLRLAANGGARVDVPAINQGIDLIEHAIGTTWTEYDDAPNLVCDCGDDLCLSRASQPLYGPCTNCVCDLQPSAVTGARWDRYTPAALAEPGRPVAVYWVDDARCLQQARQPGSDAPCAVVPVALPQVRPRATTVIGRDRDTYALPVAPPNATHHYILWQSDDGSEHRLVDVVPVDRNVGVHPLGGVFLDAAASAWSRDPLRPGIPSVSASGTHRDLVPPLESELISDSDTYEDSFARYLEDAQIAVDDATTQLSDARDDELEARRNELSTAARMSEAAVVETATLADLCGDLPGCQVPRTSPATLLELGIADPPPAAPDLTGSGYASCTEVLAGQFSDFQERIADGFDNDEQAQAFVNGFLLRALGCSMSRYFGELADLRIDALPVAVRDELAAHGSGEFRGFSGQVREQLIALFQLLEGARTDLRNVATQRFAAEVLIGAAAHQISFANVDDTEQTFCHLSFVVGLIADTHAIAATIAGASLSSGGSGGQTSPSAASSVYGDTKRALNTASTVASGSASIGQRVHSYWASEACQNQDAGELAGFQGALQLTDSMQTLVGLARSARQRSQGAFFAISALDSLQRRARFAGQRREVSQRMASTESLADLPEWHAMRSFRARRAEAALHRAQQAVFVARRAVEFRLAVDLSSMTDPEPLTPAPATWADSLFDVGGQVLSVPDTEGDVSIAAEELSLYLSRLRRFVEGYPIARRFRDAGDLQVLDLGALLDADVAAPATAQMIFKCADHPVPLLAGSLPPTSAGDPWPTVAPCEGLGDVEYAEVRFNIPAYLDDYLRDRLAAGSFNYRHELFAPNLVGTGVVDCALALDPAECYGDGNLPYSLRQEGAVAVESFESTLHTFAMEPGVIQDGRAMVAERSLTTPLSSADRRLVDPYLRTELRGRPLSGLYTLRIDGRPEINWSRLERLQLLVGYRYWTRQE